ncbi:MAG: hypothetical protein ACI87N_003605 [Flavobacteriales bacterium]|jgi:hypothetical protein
MDYLKKHKEITRTEFNRTREEIIKRLKIEFDKGRRSSNAVREVANQIYKDFIQDSLIEKYRPYFEISYNAVLSHQYNYDSKKVDSILKTLQNEVYDNYISTSRTFEQHNIGPEDFKNTTYEDFFQELLKYIVYKRCYNRLDNTVDYLAETIQLFYDLNTYEDFSNSLLEDDEAEITYERLNTFFQKHNKKLPKKRKETSSQSDDSLNKQLLRYKNQIDKFTEDERCLLIHLAINKSYELPDTEQIKLIVIAGNFNDYRIFEEFPNVNGIYNKIQKGQKYKRSPLKTKEIIDGNIEKLQLFKLTETIKLLKSIRSNL